MWNRFAGKAVIDSKIRAAVIYATAQESVSPAAVPCLFHFAGDGKPESPGEAKVYTYPSVESSKFAIPCQEDFDSTTESVSHTRNLTFLKKYIRGADFDLEAIWDEHTYFEFADRSVSKTMGTMVQEPYVNHITTVYRTPPLL